MPSEIVSDRDPRFIAMFWRYVLKFVDTKLPMSTSDHPQTDGQTEKMNRVAEDIFRSYVTSYDNWIDHLPMAEFAMNNAPSASTGHTPFYVNRLRHPRLPAFLGGVFNFSRGGSSTKASSDEKQSESQSIEEEVDHLDLSTVDYNVNQRPMKGLVETSKEETKRHTL